MAATTTPQIVCDRISPEIRVARFLRPDVRDALYDQESIADCSLFLELHEATLANSSPGDAVIVNCGLIDFFPTAFYRLLLRLKDEVAVRNGRLMLCCLTPNIKEGFELMGGATTFRGQVFESESRAIYTAKHLAS